MVFERQSKNLHDNNFSIKAMMVDVYDSSVSIWFVWGWYLLVIYRSQTMKYCYLYNSLYKICFHRNIRQYSVNEKLRSPGTKSDANSITKNQFWHSMVYLCVAEL